MKCALLRSDVCILVDWFFSYRVPHIPTLRRLCTHPASNLCHLDSRLCRYATPCYCKTPREARECIVMHCAFTRPNATHQPKIRLPQSLRCPSGCRDVGLTASLLGLLLEHQPRSFPPRPYHRSADCAVPTGCTLSLFSHPALQQLCIIWTNDRHVSVSPPPLSLSRCRSVSRSSSPPCYRSQLSPKDPVLPVVPYR